MPASGFREEPTKAETGGGGLNRLEAEFLNEKTDRARHRGGANYRSANLETDSVRRELLAQPLGCAS